LFRRAAAVLSVAFTQWLAALFIIFTFGYILLATFSIESLTDELFIIFIMLAILLFLRTISFFTLTLVVVEKKSFVGAIISSARLVFKRGFFRILAVTTALTVVKAVLFIIIFLILHGLLLSNATLLDAPTVLAFYLYFIDHALVLCLIVAAAFIPFIFFGPRLSLIALSFYAPPDEIPSAAGLGSRSLAVVVDGIILLVVFSIILSLAVAIFSLDLSIFTTNLGVIAIIAVAYFLVFAIYNIYFEVMEGGQTPGKRLMSLRVTTEDGGPVNLLQSILRNVLRVIDIVSFVMILIDRKHHRLGDVLSYTKVCFAQEQFRGHSKEDVDV